MHPDRDLGAITKDILPVFVPCENEDKFEHKELEIAQGVIKIFREVLQNAMDREHWSRGKEDPLTKIEVEWTPQSISIRNDGAGIPVVKGDIDGKEQYHITALFSRFKSSSNYKNTQAENEAGKKETKARFTGGKNGIGTKATNTYSHWLQVTTFDATRQLLFTQKWEKNLSLAHPPVVKPHKGSKGYTKVEFRPDWTRFGVDDAQGFDDAKSTSRVLEMCVWGSRACVSPHIKILLNKKLLAATSFDQFFQKFFAAENIIAYDVISETIATKVFEHEKSHKKIAERKEKYLRFEVCAARHQGFPSVGFVNALSCNEGVHMDYAFGKIYEHVKHKLEKVKSLSATALAKFKPKMVRDRIVLGLRVLLDDPKFDAQTKEKLDSPKPSQWDFAWTPTDAFLKKLDAMNLVEELVQKLERESLSSAAKPSGMMPGGSKVCKQPIIPKYECAKNAGKKGNKCILFITEGDSAKNLVDAGISTIGKDDYGIFPIRGKPLNVRGMNFSDALANTEVHNILKIMGIDLLKKEVKELNYGGGICGFTDQDVDGGHIMGLLMNLMHVLCKCGLENNPVMMMRFATPQFRLTAKSKPVMAKFSMAESFLEFTSKAELQKWIKTHKLTTEEVPKWFEVDYFKGLGSSTNMDAKRYFRTLDKRMIKLKYEGEPSDVAIKEMFDASQAEKRKHLLTHVYDPEAFVDYEAHRQVTWTEYLHKEVLPFSHEDCVRSLPHFADGLKPSQRAALFTLLHDKVHSGKKVNTITGRVTELTSYAHGEVSMHTTISMMAQNFWGTNNINLLSPLGQFGSRVEGRKSFSAPRYIFTCVTPTTQALFPQQDFDLGLLPVRIVDGEPKEPEVLLPVVPLVLINGTTGIGTGWSCDVLPHHPKDVIANVRKMLRGEPSLPSRPWFMHNQGDILDGPKPSTFLSVGKFHVEEKDESVFVHVTELPLTTWRRPYEDDILGKYGMDAQALNESKKRKRDEPLLPEVKTGTQRKVKPFIKDLKKYNCTIHKVDLQFECDREMYEKHVKGQEIKTFKLQESLNQTNMNMWNHENKLHHFENEEEIYTTFFTWRKGWYEKRKETLLQSLSSEKLRISEKARFLREVAVEKTLLLAQRPRTEIVEEMTRKNYVHITALLGLSLISLTKEMLEQLDKEVKNITMQVKAVSRKSIETMWTEDLDQFERAYDEYFDQLKKEHDHFSAVEDLSLPLKKKKKNQ
jgi:DNA topoisomerase-2